MQPPPLALQCMRKRPDRRNNRTDGILLVRLFRTANLSNWATYMRAYSAGTGTVASSGTVVVVCVRPACWGGATYDYYGSHKRGPFVRARTASAMHHGRLVRWLSCRTVILTGNYFPFAARHAAPTVTHGTAPHSTDPCASDLMNKHKG
jgi:hypothetical protein